MTVQTVLVTLGHDQIFYPGELITGHCQLDVSEEGVYLNLVYVKIFGVAKISWSQAFVPPKTCSRSRAHTVWCIESQGLLANYQEIAVENGFLPKGVHKFPFAFQLKPDLPSSFDGAFCSVRYWLETSIEPQRENTTRVMTPFKVLQPIKIDDCMLPVSAKNSKIFHGCFRKSGEYSVELTSDRCSYSAGDVLYLSGSILNKTCRKTKLFVILVQKQTIIIRAGRRKTYKRSWLLAPLNASDSLFTIKPRQTPTKWRAEPFVIPSEATPSSHCSVIQVIYYLEACLGDALFIRLPISIGAKPTRKLTWTLSQDQSTTSSTFSPDCCGSQSRLLRNQVTKPAPLPPTYLETMVALGQYP